MRKVFVIIFVCFLFVNPFSITFAKSKLMYEKAENLAIQYISNSSFDENWKNNNPIISGDGKYFFTDDENKPSYIEFKVSCDNNTDCGFVMVNVDGDDVAIPIASTSGNGPSDILIAQNGGKIKNNKFYYFSPFDQYGEDQENGNIVYIDPYIKENLKDKIKNVKKDAKEFKKSEDFKIKKEKIKDQILVIPEEKYSYKILPFANAATLTGYIPPVASNIFITGSTYSGCNGKLPCYAQFDTTYNGLNCKVGCVPISYGMIYGYYDRKGTFSNLLTGTAPTINDNNSSTSINIMIKNLGTLLGTTCSGSGGSTPTLNAVNGINYAKNKGYINSTATLYTGTTFQLFNGIKSEINSGRPIIVNTKTHSMVAFGYNSTSGLYIARINLGSGAGYTVTGNNGVIYYGSNIDFNINGLYYDNKDNGAIKSTLKIVISN